MNSLIWAEKPILFWDGLKQDDDIIRRLFYDLQKMEENNPAKGKILLVMLSHEIEDEQRQIHEDTEQPRRKDQAG